MVRLRNISVDTLHKGDTEDNNNNSQCLIQRCPKFPAPFSQVMRLTCDLLTEATEDTPLFSHTKMKVKKRKSQNI